MIHLFDLSGLDLPLDVRARPGLRALVAHRLAGLDETLLPLTEIIAVQPGDTERDIVDALGHSPLVDPWDGHRWPDPRFQPGWDFAGAYPAAYQLNFSYGSTFGQIVLVERVEGVLSDLLALCRAHCCNPPST